ncbi:anti-sigma factor family protein [Streptomyces gamaensis]|uniref:Anti-sigma factor family protein n=1 Tax=Streptomyces gamaensis TaxID=1763542 RepID=A0ABW0YQK1_9ACTN
MTGSGGPSPAEQHLGDRLAALVDGELGHDSRERVLAHLATCWKCKAEADAQRRLKNAFAAAEAPPLSEGLLARLQSLPGSDTGGGRPTGGGGGPERGSRPGAPGKDAAGPGADPLASFALLQAAAAVRPPRERGFRIHEMPAPGARGGVRGRRFAFAAAGAVSLAAIALAGAQPLGEALDPTRRGGDQSVATTPLAMTPGGADPGAFGFTSAQQGGPGEGPPPVLGVALLRPSHAPLLPPLARAALPGASLAGADTRAAQR